MGLRASVDVLEKRERALASAENRLRFLGLPARSPVAIRTELFGPIANDVRI